VSPLWPSATFMAIGPLYVPMSPLRLSATSTALYPLYGAALPPLRPSVLFTDPPSMTLCPF
jgi:hypothetical protein